MGGGRGIEHKAEPFILSNPPLRGGIVKRSSNVLCEQPHGGSLSARLNGRRGEDYILPKNRRCMFFIMTSQFCALACCSKRRRSSRRGGLTCALMQNADAGASLERLTASSTALFYCDVIIDSSRHVRKPATYRWCSVASSGRFARFVAAALKRNDVFVDYCREVEFL